LTACTTCFATPQVLFQLAALLRHADPTVRVGMLRQLKKAFERRQVTLKFAALLPLSAVDPVKEYQQLAMTILKQVVKVRARCFRCPFVLESHAYIELARSTAAGTVVYSIS
jgi:hypothetical protein